MNELDRAIKSMQRSNAVAPELYRQLIAGELWFLLPYHPEMEGAYMQVQNGSPFPFCVQTEPDGEEIVPIFSSEARLEESLQNEQLVARSMVQPAGRPVEVGGEVALPQVEVDLARHHVADVAQIALEGVPHERDGEQQHEHDEDQQRRREQLEEPESTALHRWDESLGVWAAEVVDAVHP